MKAFLSSTANPEKWQFSFHSPKSAILPRVIGKIYDPLPTGYQPGVQIGTAVFLFSAWYGGQRLNNIYNIKKSFKYTGKHF